MEYIIISTNIVPEVQTVRLYQETMTHIIEQHPEVPFELPSLTNAITGAITSPTHVEISRQATYVFVDAESTNAAGDPLRVPVKVVEGTSGRIVTAYFATTTIVREIIWRRT
jgi:hypothetical protein